MREFRKGKETWVSFTAKDKSQLGKVLTYLVQMLGEASQDDVSASLEKLQAKVTGATLTQTLETLRARKIVVEGHRPGEGGGQQRIYRIGTLSYNCGNVEVAHVRPLLAKLDEDPMAEVIRNAIDGAPKKPNKIYPRGIMVLEVELRLAAPRGILGGHPYDTTPDQHALYEQSPTAMKRPDPKESFSVFERSVTGDVVINNACLLGFITKHDYIWGLKPWEMDLISSKPLVYTGPLKLEKLPVQRQKTAGEHRQKDGAGFAWHESIPEGTVLKWELTLPAENFLDVEDFQAGLACALAYPKRSMSPARGKQFGAAELISVTEKHRYVPAKRRSFVADEESSGNGSSDEVVDVPAAPAN